MMKILEGKTLAADLRAGVAAGVREMELGRLRPPGLAAAWWATTRSSQVYVGEGQGVRRAGIAAAGPPARGH